MRVVRYAHYPHIERKFYRRKKKLSFDVRVALTLTTLISKKVLSGKKETFFRYEGSSLRSLPSYRKKVLSKKKKLSFDVRVALYAHYPHIEESFIGRKRNFLSMLQEVRYARYPHIKETFFDKTFFNAKQVSVASLRSIERKFFDHAILATHSGSMGA